MKNNLSIKVISTLLLTLLSYSSLAVNFEDKQALGYHSEVCNTCVTTADFKKVAMASAANDDAVVANLDSGDVMAFYVVDLNEPDIPHIPVIFDAYERSVPQEARCNSQSA